MAVEPSGKIRNVGVDEMFFSTTDRRGVIDGANSIFARISRIPRTKLIGKPHNVIRHPDMPAGTFRLMWDSLLDGKPFAGYVESLASDGYGYWVFATITPVAEGFLSVRITPSVRQLWEQAFAIYANTAPIEDQVRFVGGSRIDAAIAGREAIENDLRNAGFPSYEDFMLTALPAEVAARSARSQQNADRSRVDGELGEVLQGTQLLEYEINGLLARLDDFDQLAKALHHASTNVAATVQDLYEVTDAATRGSQSVSEQAPVLARAGEAMSLLGRKLAESIGRLSEELAVIRKWIMRLRFQIAQARLHNDMVTSFAIEVSGGETQSEGLAYIPILCSALQQGVEAVATEMDTANGRLRAVAQDIESASEHMKEFQRFLSTWRNLVPRFQLSRELGPYVTPIDAQLSLGHERITELRELAQRCLAEARPFDRAPLLVPIERIALVVSGTRSWDAPSAIEPLT